MNIDRRQSRETSGPLVNELLHAIGQPLTSLQICVLLRDRASLDANDTAAFMHDMADQVILLSRLFATLRRLLDAESEPLITAGKLELLLPCLLPQWHKAAFQREITLICTSLPTIAPPRQARTPGDLIETCLQDIFTAALESTPDHGSITLTLAPHSDPTPCQLRFLGGTRLSPASFASRFALPAAQALLTSSGQEFTYRLHPFEAHLVLRAPTFPVADAAVINRPPSPRDDHAGSPG